MKAAYENILRISYFAKTIFIIVTATHLTHADQQSVDYLAEYLGIGFSVLNNFANEWRSFSGELRFTNEGQASFQSRNWSIYFSSIRVFEPDSIYPNGTELGDTGLSVYHINGYLHKVSPDGKFTGFRPMETKVVPFKAKHWIVSKTDVMPNWYVTASDAEPRVIVSTQGESLRFVSPFDSKNKWKRQPSDEYNPFTPEIRLEKHRADNWKMAPYKVIPTPAEQAYDESKKFLIDSNWVIVKEDDTVAEEAAHLAEKLNLEVVERGSNPDVKYISVGVGLVLDNFAMPLENPESYSLGLGEDEKVIITGVTPAGVFYGIQSLLSLAEDKTGIPFGYVLDFPRFPYRGMHIDVSRNFHGKQDILRLLETMAMYKLNKFHFHLTDDEGWRLDIPGIPELTEVGGQRCHDLEETSCLLPQLGSDPNLPNSGSGYYTQDDYKEILAYATARHIEVIPEFDMPGHGRAAIVSMLARYHRYISTDKEKAEEFLLTDLEDKSKYRSIQEFDDNAINPCINTTYNFVRAVIRGVVDLHKDIQPLKVFNLGGDEVPEEAWENSPACEHLLEESGELQSNKDLKRMFVMRVGQLAREEGLDLAGWEDGLMDGNTPFNRSSFPDQNLVAYYWDNVWEWGRGQRAYIGANAGFKAVLAHATHLYFDFPYEPDPEERGYYWATRTTDTKKTFGFTPENIYDNMDVDRMGKPIDKGTICENFGCAEIEEDKIMNIIGMQGQLWSETVRTSGQLSYMIYPRLLALAERAWHVGQWEGVDPGIERESIKQQEWERFANTLGHRELGRLDKMGIAYHLPPPGARVLANMELVVGCAYPGLKIEFSVDGGSSWKDHEPGNLVSSGVTINLRTRSADGKRTSRVVMLTAPEDNSTIPSPTLPPESVAATPSLTLSSVPALITMYKIYKRL